MLKPIIISILTIAFVFFVAGCIELGEGEGGGFDISDGVWPQRNITGSLYGTVTNYWTKVPVEGVSVFLISDTLNYSALTSKDGKYNITGIQPGTYTVLVKKEGYRNATISNFTFVGGSYPWNVTISKDCLYYLLNTSLNFVLRYGYNGTVYRGRVTCNVSYPEGSRYSMYPAVGELSSVNTIYKGGNRMLEFTLDNSKGRYSYVQGYIFIDMNGTRSIQLFDRKEMSIQEAALSKPGHLGEEIFEDKKSGRRAMIDPSDSEIKSLAQQIKNETGSNDTWTVAKALFVWLKNNTEYYNTPEEIEGTHTAVEVLHSRKGDCDELSYLYISLCRAAGIPARFVSGYLLESKPEEYTSHVWAEFYDGEWVPVEVAGSGSISSQVDLSFGVLKPSHAAVFFDDGTNESIKWLLGGGLYYFYYDHPSTFSPYTYYDAVYYNPMYLSVCADGTRTLTAEKE